MFIKTGKSLFGNTGLIISLIILCVLLYLSYNKCYIGSIENFDCITDPSDPSCTATTPTPIPTALLKTPPPKNVRINITGGTITVNFTIDYTLDKDIPIKFVIVLVQYDSNKKNTGNKFVMSNESAINSSVTVNSETINTNMCVLSNGQPVCTYVFENIDIRDPTGNLYYYKLGISSIYNNGYNSPFITSYNINSPDDMFTLDSSTDNQNKMYSDFLLYQKGQAQNGKISANVYDNTISTADGQYELIKSQLGNYPDDLLLGQQTVDQGTLNDLVDKSMAQALLNVNVS
jgi:hypothetical protein